MKNANRIRPSYRVLGCFLLIIYLAVLTYFLFFAESLGRSGADSEMHINLVLFREIRRFYEYRHLLGMRVFLLNTVGNILAFVPLGFFVPMLRGREKGFLISVLSGVVVSLGVECMQLLLFVGSFDVDDILLNTIGALLGYLVFRLWYFSLPPVPVKQMKEAHV